MTTADALRPELLQATDDEIEDAVAYADPMVMRGLLYQLTGDEELAQIWDLAKWAPTAANTQPLRIVFARTDEGRARLLPHMSEGNKAKTEAAFARVLAGRGAYTIITEEAQR